MALLTSAIRLIGFAFGTALALFLLVLVARQRRRRSHYLILAILALAGVWHVVGLTESMRQALLTGFTPLPLLTVIANVAGGLACLLAIGGFAFLVANFKSAKAVERRFGLWYGASLLVVSAGMGAGLDSGSVVMASLAPPFVLATFVYRYHFLGLLLGRRVLFALVLGTIAAAYLFVVRRLSDLAELELSVFGRLFELALLLTAGLVWLPLYGWMSRYLSRGTRLYDDASRKVTQDAAAILDLGARLDYLAKEVATTFGLRRVLLTSTGPPVLTGQTGGASLPDPDREELESTIRKQRLEIVHVERTSDEKLRAILARSGYHYLFPLWYEDHLAGLLLADLTPHLYLDEYEEILLAVSRQLAHSIETCRLIDGTIRLQRTLADQEHLATLGQLAATVAHEVKNPLSSVKTLAQLMREDVEFEARYGRDLNFIVSEMDRLNHTVRQLLTYARPASGQTENGSGQEAAAADLLQALSGTLGREYRSLSIIAEPVDPKLRLPGKSRHIFQQILLNLALNAVQACGESGEVRLGARRREDRWIEFTVTDTGPGVPAEMRERIFEPFYTTRQKGTGLGLAIVLKNVRLLDGKVDLESPVSDGHGARFRVSFPEADRSG